MEKNVKPLLVKKNKYILSPIDNNDYVFFVATGIVRGFIKDDDKEITTWISLGNEFVGAIQHPEENIQPSIEYLQALENSELVAIPNLLIDKLYENYHETNIIGRKILALQYHAASERAIIARIPSAERRYEKFLEMNHFDVSKVPLRCIASYLGMRLETLSRIRSKLVKEMA
ncbi:Crp/Fnr family transcriptional regulator [Pedobacter sp. Leaf216]|uniref:Crp/Fnr family transcriptional regulator n=1 Tax=Pedobacter sp. Leaf216 TaxID=1735684 RepID=UPI001F1AE8E6|nr:Crp/Fnr family transcriptional regulator [Pedobacter sp. Leaf216]